MTVDIASLQIRIDSMEAREAARDLDRLRVAGQGAERQGDALTGVMGKLAGVFAAMKIVDAAAALIKTQREFDKLNASLITATDSVANAAQAFGALQAFASSTPYGLQEVTKAFIQLRNLGLTPSERALNSYGNTASAMGKSLNQMVEAVADAATGEFERLKEFGIKAKQNGDQVSLTFQGVTSNIANNAASIEKYLVGLGETKFAGGMELQARTLDGAISNLGDTWDMTKLAFSQSGFGDGAMAGVLALSGALQDLQAVLRATGLAASEESRIVSESGGLHKALTTVFETVAVVGENVAFVFRSIGREIGGIAAQAVAFVSGDFKGAGAIHDQMVADAEEDRRMTDARTEKILWAAAVEQKVRENAAEEKKREQRDDLAGFGIKQAATGQSVEAAKKAAAAYAASVKSANEFIAALKVESSEVGLTADQVKMLAAARAAAKAPTAELRMEIMKAALALDIETKAFAASEVARKSVAAASQALTDSRTAEYASIAAEVKANTDAIATYGLSKSAIEALTLARMQDRLARRGPQDLDLDEAEVQHLERMIALQKEKTATATTLGGLDTGSSVTQAKELLDILVAVDNAAKSAAQGMADSFGRIGSAIGGLTTALSGYAVQQQAIAAQLAAVKADPKSSAQKIAQAEMAASKASAQAQIKSYGDMAGAAKGFFKENSKGYKVLETTEKAYRAVEMAMAIESMVTKSGLLTAFTGIFATSKAAEVAATVATVPATVAAEGVKQTALATTAMAGAIAVPFPGNLAAVGIVAAMLAAIGLAGGGGGGGGKSVSQQRQESQGTGSVFGDSSAKSESISRSIELAAANSSIELTHTAGMLASLKAIENSIGGLANLLVRGSGLTGDVAGDVNGAAQQTFDKVFGPGSLGEKLTGGLIGKVVGSIFGGKITTLDTGLTASAASLGSIAAGGLNAQQYTDIKKSGGLFSSSKTSTQTSDLGAEANDQFAKVILNLSTSVKTAAGMLGVGGDAFTAKLNTFVVDIGKISLKGLSGTEIQEALETVFSKLGDDMAQFGVAGLESFQKVGEGYFETLTRIAVNYANLNSIMESIGTTFGATGMSSIAARERLIELAGGIDELASQTSSFASNFLTEAERLAPVQKYVTDQLAAMGLQSLDTRDKFKEYVLGLANSGKLATDAGAQQYASLLALSEAFAKTHAATVDLTKSEQGIADERKDLQDKLDELTLTQAQLADKARAAIDGHNLALYDQVIAAQAAKDATTKLLDGVAKAYSDVEAAVNAQKSKLNGAYTVSSDLLQLGVDAASATVSKLSSLSQALKSTLDSLTIPGQEKSDRQAAQAQIAAALAIGKAGGPLPDLDALKGALATVAKDASSQFSSYAEYQRDLYRTKNNVAGLDGLTDRQLSDAQLTLKTLQDQKKALDLAHKAEIAALDATLEQAKLQTDLLGGIAVSLMTLPDALKALAAAVGSASKDPALGVDALTGLYKDLLGRAPDVEGTKFWKDALAAGMSLEDVKANIIKGAEYKNLHPPGFASGGDHAGGLRVVGEKGWEVEATGPSRIWNQRQLADALAGGGNAELVAEVRALRAELSQIKASSARNAASSEEGTGLLKRVIRNDKLYTKEVA